jgi:ech hydrogenase subunit A
VNTLFFLVAFPLIVAAIMLILPKGMLRNPIVNISSAVIAAASIYLLATNYNTGPTLYPAQLQLVEDAMIAIEMLIALYILYASIKSQKYLATILIILQSAIIIYFEITYAPVLETKNNVFIDQLSIIMALIIGIIGSLICVYALGYMKDFHEHNKDVKDHRNWFFFIMFAFLSAMFGLVFSNNLMWVYFFWEITTISSFLLIGYTGTHEAKNNAFNALVMNLLGGLAFAAALFYLGSSPATGGIMELSELMSSGKAVALIPAVLISFAGITKSAQMPFSSWLVGAMVAPTPVSALLHSSTMVKAGVYIIIRFAPVLQGSLSGYMIALIGGFTFLLASAIAVSQSNAKKVLAYSTIANLGLIVACAGIGTYEAVWAAILLMIFHAVSKGLLFLCVGTVEHRINSRDIEDMGGLIVRMPKVAFMMLIGIAGMFLAPFGMLISKWATLRAFIDASPLISPILLAIIAYGSAVTVFFWAKWMGRLIEVTQVRKQIEDKISGQEWTALYSLAALTVLLCLMFPIVSSVMIEPFILKIYNQQAQLGQDNITIMLMMLGLILVMPLSMLYYGKDRKHISAYMCGRTTTPDMKFKGALGITRELALKNYYMQGYFGESKLYKIGTALCIGLMALMFWGIMFGEVLI